MNSDNKNSASGTGPDLDRLLENAAKKSALSDSGDQTVEKARSEITAQTDLMIKEIEERRARREARQREMEKQILAEKKAKAKKQNRDNSDIVSPLSTGPRPSAKTPKTSNAPAQDDVLSNKKTDVRPPSRSEGENRGKTASRVKRPSASVPEKSTASGEKTGKGTNASSASSPGIMSKRRSAPSGETQKIPRITETVRQDLTAHTPPRETKNAASAPRERKESDMPKTQDNHMSVGSEPTPQPEEKAKSKKKNGDNKVLKEIRDWVFYIALAVVIALLIRSFVFTLVKVEGTSMEPTLQGSDKLYVNRFFYKPEKGDVIVFKPASDPKRPYIKRVIATEGDTLYIDFETGDVYVNDKIIDEPYIKDKTMRTGSYIMDYIANGRYSRDNPIVIEKDHVFVMGDNRNNSKDSREIGQVPEDEIVGGTVFRFWPIKNFGSVSYPFETSYLTEDEDNNLTSLS